MKNIYKYRVLGEGGGAEEWCFYYNAWNDDNTIVVERGNSNIVIRGMVKGSKQNTKSRLNSGKTLSLPLFFLHVHSPFVLSSLSLSFFAFIVFTRTFSATTLRNIAFSQTQSDFVPFSFRGNIEFPFPPRCLIWKLNPPDGDLFWRNLYRLRSSGNATLRAQLLPRLLRGNFIMRFRE